MRFVQGRLKIVLPVNGQRLEWKTRFMLRSNHIELCTIERTGDTLKVLQVVAQGCASSSPTNENQQQIKCRFVLVCNTYHTNDHSYVLECSRTGRRSVTIIQESGISLQEEPENQICPQIIGIESLLNYEVIQCSLNTSLCGSISNLQI